MRRSYFVGVIASSTVALTACSLFTSLDGFTSTTIIAGPDADASALGEGSADSSADTTSPILDAGDDAGPNFHPQGTFEGSDCAPWGAYEGDLARVLLAHSGSGACRVCQVASAMKIFSGDDNGASGPGVVGATYRAEGWVRTDPGRAAPAAVAIVLRNIPTGAPFMDLENQASPEVTINGTWTHLETTLTMTMPGTLNVFVYGNISPAACFIFDDVTLRRVK